MALALQQLDGYLRLLNANGLPSVRGDVVHLGAATGAAYLAAPDCGLLNYKLTKDGLIQYYWAPSEDKCLSQEEPADWFRNDPQASPINWTPIVAAGAIAVSLLLIHVAAAGAIAYGAGVGAAEVIPIGGGAAACALKIAA